MAPKLAFSLETFGQCSLLSLPYLYLSHRSLHACASFLFSLLIRFLEYRCDSVQMCMYVRTNIGEFDAFVNECLSLLLLSSESPMWLLVSLVMSVWIISRLSARGSCFDICGCLPVRICFLNKFPFNSYSVRCAHLLRFPDHVISVISFSILAYPLSSDALPTASLAVLIGQSLRVRLAPARARPRIICHSLL